MVQRPLQASNGNGPAPPNAGGAVRASASRFPPQLTGGSVPRFYEMGRAEAFGLSLLRWILLALILGAVALWLIADGWSAWLALLPVASALALTVAYRLLRRRNFVTFTPSSRSGEPEPEQSPISPRDKAPVYVTGTLAVNQRTLRFTCLPSFYRTFASREHVLIGACQPRRVLGLAAWPERELGLWYAFIQPRSIHSISTGRLHFGRHALYCLEVVYDAEWKPTRGSRRGVETIYVGTTVERDLVRIHRDLLSDLAATAGRAPGRHDEQTQ